MVLYVDGSSYKDAQGDCHCGYAVVSDSDVISKGLPSHLSAQIAELIALTEACKAAKGKSVTVFTNSRYAFGVVHDFGALWRHRQFLRADGKPILNGDLVSDLLEAILLPTAIAVCKCKAHSTGTDSINRGNRAADTAARAAAALPHPSSHCLIACIASLPLPTVVTLAAIPLAHTPRNAITSLPNGPP
ncbi:MAG: RNase H family protein [Aeromonas sp.]